MLIKTEGPLRRWMEEIIHQLANYILALLGILSPAFSLTREEQNEDPDGLDLHSSGKTKTGDGKTESEDSRT